MKRFLLAAVLGVLSVLAICQDNLKIEQLGLAYITDAKVQTELKLTAAQKSLVKSQFEAYLTKAKTIFTGVTKENQNQRKQQLKQVQDSISAVILGKLTPAQKLRLRQLVLQIKGSWALTVPEVKSSLKITDAQVAKIRACQKEVMDKVSALEAQRRQQLELIPKPSNRNDSVAMQAYKSKVEAQIKSFRATDVKAIAEYENAGKIKALNALNATQRKAWFAMLGPKWGAK